MMSYLHIVSHLIFPNSNSQQTKTESWYMDNPLEIGQQKTMNQQQFRPCIESAKRKKIDYCIQIKIFLSFGSWSRLEISRKREQFDRSNDRSDKQFWSPSRDVREEHDGAWRVYSSDKRKSRMKNYLNYPYWEKKQMHLEPLFFFKKKRKKRERREHANKTPEVI